MTLAPMEATYRVTVRNSGDEVALSDDDLQHIISDYLERDYEGVLAAVEVKREVVRDEP